MANLLQEKIDRLSLQGKQIQKYLNHHQNKLAHFQTQLAKSDVDLHGVETDVDKISQIYQDVEARFTQNFVALTYNFFPTNLNVPYSVKYAGGTSPSDLTLCHNSKFLLKEIRSSLRKKIFSGVLPSCNSVQEKDCVVAVDLKRTVMRGVVVSVGPGAIVTLLDIDVGELKMATADNIYTLDEEAVSLYALCIKCSLDGDLTDLNKYWTTDLSYYFVSALKYGELMMEAKHLGVDDTTFPPRFKVSVEILIDDAVVMNINHWVCDQLLPALKQRSETCLDMNKVIQGLPPVLLTPYMPTATDYGHLASSTTSQLNSSQIVSSPESSVRSSSSSDEFSVEIKINAFDTPRYGTTASSTVSTPVRQKEIDVVYTNAHMISPSSDSLEGAGGSKCECGVDCSGLMGHTPSELLLANPKVPRITTVIPSLARIPHGEMFYYTMKNKSKSSLLPTPINQRSVPNNKNETGDTFFNNFYESRKGPLLATPTLLPHPSANHNGTSCPHIQRNQWSPNVPYQGILVPIRDVTTRGKWSNGVKHRSDNCISGGGGAPGYSNGTSHYANGPNSSHFNSSSGSRRPPPKSHLYTNPLLPTYVEDSYDISGDMGMGWAYEKSLGAVPNSRGEGLSLKEQHYCQAEHLDKVPSVKLPGSVLLVEPGQERQALVAHAEHPGKFYVNLLENSTGHMDELEDALNKHYSTASNLVSLVSTEEARYHLGDFVAAKWKTDNRWYRAKVTDWLCVQKAVAILYVDHGNVDLVPLDYIQPLLPTFAQMAAMAQPCHLANIVPVGSSSWTAEAAKLFVNFCTLTEHEIFSLTFQPTSSNHSSSSWSVILRNSAGECINDLLLSKGLATPTKLNGHSSQTLSSASNHSLTSGSNHSLTSVPSAEDKEEARRKFYRKQIARNQKRNAQLLERIRTDVLENAKVLIVLRGLPGSGKSTRAQQLVEELTALGGSSAVFSADLYFQTKDGYQYDGKKISHAHNWAFKQTEAALEAFRSPLIIDNTNTEEFEILNYYNLAYLNWYKCYVLEPETVWAYDVRELARRNRHGVPEDRIAKMLRRWCWPLRQKWTRQEEGSVSGESVDGCAHKLHDTSLS